MVVNSLAILPVMPPKGKAAADAKRKIVEDKTFGLKNKNKSKKVQAYVHQVEKQASQKVDGSGKRRGGAGSAAAGSSSKAEEKALSKKALMAKRLEELSLLSQPVVDKPKKASAEEEARRKQLEEEEAERIRIANLPVEEQIEEERMKLKTRTPVTKALFLEWKKRKDEQRLKREAEALAAAQKNISKAERARGAGLTGRQLFEQHRDIFVDDEAADDTKYARPENVWIADEHDMRQHDDQNELHHTAEKAQDLHGDAPSRERDSQLNPDEEDEPPADAGNVNDVNDDSGDAEVGDESLFL